MNDPASLRQAVRDQDTGKLVELLARMRKWSINSAEPAKTAEDVESVGRYLAVPWRAAYARVFRSAVM